MRTWALVCILLTFNPIIEFYQFSCKQRYTNNKLKKKLFVIISSNHAMDPFATNPFWEQVHKHTKQIKETFHYKIKRCSNNVLNITGPLWLCVVPIIFYTLFETKIPFANKNKKNIWNLHTAHSIIHIVKNSN